MRKATMWWGASVVLMLTGCGGGGDTALTGTATTNTTNTSSAVGTSATTAGAGVFPAPYEETGPGSPSTCPHALPSDVWINNRLGCLVAGQRFLADAVAATGMKADTAYVIQERPLDGQLNSLLFRERQRNFQYFLCVKGAPQTSGAYFEKPAADLQQVMGLIPLPWNTKFLPPGIHVGALMTGPFVKTTCDPKLHPVIVNYDTGRIESVNPTALSALTVFDQ